jgi:mannose/fructose/N-acetylgalactosamine-specific phosphotransferase system component IIB
MSVAHMRIDNRLIHGQVTIKWVGSVRADRLVVVNDAVAADEIQKMILPQAARGVKTSILTIDQALAYCAKPESSGERIMVIAKFPSDALALLKGGLQAEEINVGNQAPTPGTKFTMVTHSIAVTAEDASIYREIASMGTPLVSMMMPSDKRADFVALITRKGL